MSSEQKIHLGVYGIFIRNGLVLLIKKARGPYTGLYDLPGGRLEFGETIEQCLRRELDEETGVKPSQINFLGVNEYQCKYIKDGESKDFHHVGIYYLVELDPAKLKTNADGQDSLGAVMVDTDTLSENNTSPIAFQMIKNI